jgi:hypothetical protein
VFVDEQAGADRHDQRPFFITDDRDAAKRPHTTSHVRGARRFWHSVQEGAAVSVMEPAAE